MNNLKFIISLVIVAVIFNISILQAQTRKDMETYRLQQTILDIFRGADEHDWLRVERAFAPAVELDYSSMTGGEPAKLSPQQITDSWKGLLPGFEATHHQISNFSMDINDQTARVSAYGTATHYLSNASGKNVWTVVGTYDFELKRSQANWQVSAMRFNFKYQDGNANLPQLAQAKVQGMDPDIRDGMEVIDAFFDALENQDFDQLLELFMEDARQINAYVPEGFPKSFDGREAIFKQYRSLPQNFGQMAFPRTIHATGDPNLFFVQFQGKIDMKAGGQYNNEYIGIFRLKDGLIHEYTEYFNPLVMAKAFGIELK